MRAFRLGLIGLLLVGCGGDGGGGGLGPPADANVDGSWTATWTNLQRSGFSCSISATNLQINQNGTTFTGNYSGGTLTCNGVDAGGLDGRIVNGLVNGQSVTFDLDYPGFHNTGTVSGNSMSGSATADLSPFGTPVRLRGTWSASRQ